MPLAAFWEAERQEETALASERTRSGHGRTVAGRGVYADSLRFENSKLERVRTKL